MMLEGRALRSKEAREAGLVHRVVDGPALLEEAIETADGLARRSPEAVAALKRAVYDGASLPLEAGLHIERAQFLATASTDAAKRAMQLYTDDAEELGDIAPWQAEHVMERWQDGTAVDMIA